MESFVQDLRHALRLLVRNPGFSFVATLTLALGIGANCAIFSVVDAVLLQPSPYKDPERLVMIWETEPSAPQGLFPVTGPDFVDWRSQNGVFDGLAAGTSAGATLTGPAEPLKLQGLEISPETFELLGIQPLKGRTFAPEEAQPGHNRVVILSYGLWQRAVGGEETVVGRKIRLDGEPYDVVGIMPSGFVFPPIWGSQPEYWVPLNLELPSWRKSRGNHWLWVMGRLKTGIPITRAQAEMATISERLTQQYPDTNTGVAARLRTLRDHLTGRVKPALLVLFATVGFLLLIACANVANLLLAKAVGRQREIAIRLAVGSGRLRLVRQLLTESVLLFFVGGLGGLLVGGVATRLLLRAAPAGYIPVTANVHLDARVFAFTFLIAFLTGALAGLAPAIQATHPDLASALKEGSATVASAHRRSRSLLTAAEIALASVMLISAGLALKSLMRLLGVNAGFDPHGVLTARISLPESQYSKQSQIINFYHELLDRIRALPGVESVAATSELPLEGGNNGTLILEGQPAAKNMWSSPLVEWCRVTPDYFRTLRIPLLKGRDFTWQDSTGSLEVAIINETMARHFWPNQDVVGKRFSQDSTHPKWITVVGVVGDVREFGLDQAPIPEAYFSESQEARSGLVLVVRTSIEPFRQVRALTNVVHALDKDLPLYGTRTLEVLVSRSSSQQRFIALLLALFAALAMVLASVGIYGVVAHSVAQRTHEFGIRMALGAGRQEVLNMVLSEGLRLALAGVLLGVGGAWALTRFLASLLYGVRPRDPATFVIASLILPTVALLASYLPARRATKADPMAALRYE